ncbi:hypothetical protein Geoth_1833 [Parageobacillus thermoglucosidasius C56-YS93]|uniref:Uncharacterized protein n=1 Tax=Geobacillus sp. (strain Y4.1MC1) TaxID=581103 RepID=A0A7U3YEW7_GEOS0|nr:hypothetical protein Geoth_1833 [Parageobacillus thermoglucosidasius C56-YS93]
MKISWLTWAPGEKPKSRIPDAEGITAMCLIMTERD